MGENATYTSEEWGYRDPGTRHELQETILQVIIWWTAAPDYSADSVALVKRVRLRDVACCHRAKTLWLICDQPWGSKIIYKCFEEFTTFLNCRYKTLVIFGPLWGCMPDPYTIHLLTTKRIMKSLRASRNHEKESAHLDPDFHTKINRSK